MTPIVSVVAAILLRPSGEVLIAQRPLHKNMGGLWEFPGGKIEPGETPEAALVRELEEELGITVAPEALQPLTFVSHDYYHASVIPNGGTPEGSPLPGKNLSGISEIPHPQSGIRNDVKTPPFHLLMLAYTLCAWQGEPQAHEHSALAWVMPEQLADYPMPPADVPLVEVLKKC